MGTIRVNYNLIFRVCAVIFAVIFIIYQPDIFLYLFLAFILTLIGKPIVNFFSKMRVFRWYIPRSISAVIAILIFIIVMVLSMLFFVPSLVKEIRSLQNIDYDALANGLNYILSEVQNFLYEHKMLNSDETLVGIIMSEMKNTVDMSFLTRTVGNIVTSTSSFFFGMFAVFFITFFFIKDDIRLENVIKVFFSDSQLMRITAVSNKINHLLSRYFIGILVKTFIMTILLYILFAIFGIKSALLLALIGAITNIIPYLGPILGAVICGIFAIINCIGLGAYGDIFPAIIKIILAFVGANAVDNMVLGPLIYSQSIKAHPVEVFLVTILGGRVAGMAGMILGIPVYTILRIIVIEIYNSIKRNEKIETADTEVYVESSGDNSVPEG